MDCPKLIRKVLSPLMKYAFVAAAVEWIRENMAVDEEISLLNITLNVLLVSTGFAMAFWVLSLTGQVRLEKDAPAWVQAIGSVVAIFVAVIVPARQRRQQRADAEIRESREARSCASDLLSDVAKFITFIAIFRSDLEHAIEKGDDHVRGQLIVPKGLHSSRRTLHVLGDPGDSLMHALYYTELINDTAEMRHSVSLADLQRVERLLKIVEDEVDEALEGMEQLLE